MGKQTLKTLAEALVDPMPAGACLDHCMRGIKFAAGLKQLALGGTVEIVQALVDGRDGGMSRKILHCWVELNQSKEKMVMDATANKPITSIAEYYANRNPTDVKRFSPERMHELLTKAARAEWFERTSQEVAQYTGTSTPPPALSPSGTNQTQDPPALDERRA